jgi:hypothetical protein
MSKRVMRDIVIVLVLPLCWAGAMAQETRPSASVCASCRFGHTAVEDTREVFKAPLRWTKPQWRSAALKATISAGSIALLDQPVRDHLQAHSSATADRIADAF